MLYWALLLPSPRYDRSGQAKLKNIARPMAYKTINTA